MATCLFFPPLRLNNRNLEDNDLKGEVPSELGNLNLNHPLFVISYIILFKGFIDIFFPLVSCKITLLTAFFLLSCAMVCDLFLGEGGRLKYRSANNSSVVPQFDFSASVFDCPLPDCCDGVSKMCGTCVNISNPSPTPPPEPCREGISLFFVFCFS